MVAFNRFSSVLLAVLYATYSNAAPRPNSFKHRSHRVRNIGRNLTVETFHPASDYKIFGAGIELPQGLIKLSHKEKTLSFVTSQLKIDSDTLVYTSGFSTDNHQVGYMKQLHNGIPFVNAVANVAFKGNKVIAFGSSFVKTANIADSKATVDVNAVIAKIEMALDDKKNDIEPTLEYLALEDGSVALVHVLQVQNEELNSWYEVYVDAHSGELLSVTDFVADATYRVLPVWKETIAEGLETLTDPQITSASPEGWHTPQTPLVTAGNNVITNPLTSNFLSTYNSSLPPTTGGNRDAAITNAFYVTNSYHDTLYLYGFTEAAFNFQTNNFGKGGRGNDRVLINIQDPSGTNNANFATPPDWFSHSDSATVGDFALGQWVTNTPGGIRSHPYSTSASVNPLRYSTIATLNEVHDIGEVWANILHNVYAALVAEHGFSFTARSNPDGSEGNGTHFFLRVSSTNRGLINPLKKVVFLHLLVDALSIQPCNPTLPTARDAWIQADQNRYGGANACLLWNAFASRGLGVGAANHRDSTAVPSGC
ncbi:putative extracellular elastinolytic metalloproteinase precursor [Moniliophthora roreri]|nr:putative extracellular elastinolytic metalloproteinase precursor [Moniliophthora roreri]